MSNSETSEIKARTTIGVGFIAIGIVVTLFVLWAAEPIRKVVPVCISTFSQLCSYLGGTMIVVYMAIFGLVMPITGILLIERDYELVSRRE
jgi:hypothetical protein